MTVPPGAWSLDLIDPDFRNEDTCGICHYFDILLGMRSVHPGVIEGIAQHIRRDHEPPG